MKFSPSFKCVFIFVFAIILAARTVSADEFLLRDGQSPIVFLGDSITEQRRYTAFIESYVLTRFPQWNVKFRNVGWGGDTSWFSRRGNIETGFPRDVAPLKPAVLLIDYGMNDARGGDNNLQRYIDSTTDLVRRAKAMGTRVVLVTPSPEERYQADQPGGSAYNAMLLKYSDALQKIAAAENVAFVDQIRPFLGVIENGRKTGALGKDGPPRLIPDNIHPNWAGHLVMAVAILKGMNAPSLVSRVAIDAANGRATAQGAAVDALANNLKAARDKQLSFRRTDAALPMPLQSGAVKVLRAAGLDILSDLNRYELQVANLPRGTYEIFVDEASAGIFTSEKLASGANVALNAGPISDQSGKLFESVLAKNELYFNRWRNVQLQPAADTDAETKKQAALAALDQQIADKEAEIDKLRRPLPHIWKIVPVAAAPTNKTATAATNLAFNGDFEMAAENSLPAGWRMWGDEKFKIAANYTRDTANAHSGEASFRVFRPAGTSGYVAGDPAKNVIPVQRGMSYRVTFWAKADRPGSATVGFSSYSDLKPMAGWNRAGNYTFNADTNWKKHEFDIIEGFDFLLLNSRYLIPDIRAGSPPRAGDTTPDQDQTLWIDDLSVTAVPATD